jgi:hypothetical protein
VPAVRTAALRLLTASELGRSLVEPSVEPAVTPSCQARDASKVRAVLLDRTRYSSR